MIRRSSPAPKRSTTMLSYSTWASNQLHQPDRPKALIKHAGISSLQMISMRKRPIWITRISLEEASTIRSESRNSQIIAGPIATFRAFWMAFSFEGYLHMARGDFKVENCWWKLIGFRRLQLPRRYLIMQILWLLRSPFETSPAQRGAYFQRRRGSAHHGQLRA